MTARQAFIYMAAVLVEFGLLAACAHVADERGAQVVRFRAHEATIARRCTIFVDGSAQCPPGVFFVDQSKGTK